MKSTVRSLVLFLLAGAIILPLHAQDVDMELVSAVQQGASPEKIKALIDAGADVDARTDDGKSALHSACARQEIELARVLVQNGADINSRSLDRATPLSVAVWDAAAKLGWYNRRRTPSLTQTAWNETVEVVRYLMEHGADVFADHGAAFRAAAESGSRELLEELTVGQNLPTRGPLGREILIASFRSGKPDIAEYLVEQGVDLNTPDQNGITPVEYALDNDMEELFFHMLAAGGDLTETLKEDIDPEAMQLINEKVKEIEMDPSFIPPSLGPVPARLLAAMKRTHPADSIEKLVEEGADVNESDRFGYTPLQIAARFYPRDETVPLARLLVDRGADVNKANRYGESPLSEAVERLDVPLVEYLIEKGADVEFVDRFGRTAIYYAFVTIGEFREMPETVPFVVRLLVEAGVPISTDRLDDFHRVMLTGDRDVIKLAIDHAGHTAEKRELRGHALMEAIRKSDYEWAKSLVEEGAELDIRQGQETPLSTAVTENSASRGEFQDFVDLLLEHGADINADNGSALRFLVSQGEIERVGWMLEMGAKAGGYPPEYEPILAGMTYPEMVRLLVERGAPLNFSTEHGLTPLNFAVRRGLRDTAEYLIGNGADVDFVNSEGRTALMIAAEAGLQELVWLLLNHGADVEVKDSEGRRAIDYAYDDEKIKGMIQERMQE